VTAGDKNAEVAAACRGQIEDFWRTALRGHVIPFCWLGWIAILVRVAKERFGLRPPVIDADNAAVETAGANFDHGVSKQIGLFTSGRRIETRRQRAG